MVAGIPDPRDDHDPAKSAQDENGTSHTSASINTSGGMNTSGGKSVSYSEKNTVRWLVPNISSTMGNWAEDDSDDEGQSDLDAGVGDSHTKDYYSSSVTSPTYIGRSAIKRGGGSEDAGAISEEQDEVAELEAVEASSRDEHDSSRWSGADETPLSCDSSAADLYNTMDGDEDSSLHLSVSESGGGMTLATDDACSILEGDMSLDMSLTNEKSDSSLPALADDPRTWRYVMQAASRSLQDVLLVCEASSSTAMCEEALVAVKGVAEQLEDLKDTLVMIHEQANKGAPVAWEVRTSAQSTSPKQQRRRSGGGTGGNTSDRDYGENAGPRETEVGEDAATTRNLGGRIGEDSAACLNSNLESMVEDGGEIQTCADGESIGPRPRRWSDVVKVNSDAWAKENRSLHEKLLSPERRRGPAAEVRAKAEARHAAAERNRKQQEYSKLQRLREAEGRRREVERRRHSLIQRAKTSVEARMKRADEVRLKHLTRKARRAGEESEKVDEIAFIKSLSTENLKAELDRRLHDSAERREERKEAIRRRQEDAAARRKALILEKRERDRAERLQLAAEVASRVEESEARRSQMLRDNSKMLAESQAAREEAARGRRLRQANDKAGGKAGKGKSSIRTTTLASISDAEKSPNRGASGSLAGQRKGGRLSDSEKSPGSRHDGNKLSSVQVSASTSESVPISSAKRKLQLFGEGSPSSASLAGSMNTLSNHTGASPGTGAATAVPSGGAGSGTGTPNSPSQVRHIGHDVSSSPKYAMQAACVSAARALRKRAARARTRLISMHPDSYGTSNVTLDGDSTHSTSKHQRSTLSKAAIAKFDKSFSEISKSVDSTSSSYRNTQHRDWARLSTLLSTVTKLSMGHGHAMRSVFCLVERLLHALLPSHMQVGDIHVEFEPSQAQDKCLATCTTCAVHLLSSDFSNSPLVTAWAVRHGLAPSFVDLARIVLQQAEASCRHSWARESLHIVSLLLSCPSPYQTGSHSFGDKDGKLQWEQGMTDLATLAASTPMLQGVSDSLAYATGSVHSAKSLALSCSAVQVVLSLISCVNSLPSRVKGSVTETLSEALEGYGLQSLIGVMASCILDDRLADMPVAHTLRARCCESLVQVCGIDAQLGREWLRSPQGVQEFTHVVAAVLQSPQSFDDDVLNGVLALLANFLFENPDAGVALSKLGGPGSTLPLLTAVARLPARYFVIPSLRDLVMPVVVAGVWSRTSLAKVLGKDMSLHFVARFVQEKLDLPSNVTCGLDAAVPRHRWKQVLAWLQENADHGSRSSPSQPNSD